MDCISIVERASIMRVLRHRDNWESQRRRRHIRILRQVTATGPVFRYAVGQGSFNTGGEALSVGEAVDEINSIVDQKPRRPYYQPPYKDDDL